MTIMTNSAYCFTAIAMLTAATVSTAHADQVARRATVTHVSVNGSANRSDQYFHIGLDGGTGVCGDSLVVFSTVAVRDQAQADMLLRIATAAFLAGKPVDVWAVGTSCDDVNFLRVRQ